MRTVTQSKVPLQYIAAKLKEYIFLINFLQIIPEEEALLEIFGEEYEEYKKNVRRWI